MDVSYTSHVRMSRRSRRSRRSRFYDSDLFTTTYHTILSLFSLHTTLLSIVYHFSTLLLLLAIPCYRGGISKRSFCFISLEMLNSSISSISKTEKCLLIQELMS
jgi:hypothetical protein